MVGFAELYPPYKYLNAMLFVVVLNVADGVANPVQHKKERRLVP